MVAGLGWQLALHDKAYMVNSLFYQQAMLDDTIVYLDPKEATPNEEWERVYIRALLFNHAHDLWK